LASLTSRTREPEKETYETDEERQARIYLAGLDKELRFYLLRSRSTYARMPEMQKPTSDLVVDGTKTPGEIVDEILTYINTLNHYDAPIDENNDPVYDPAPLKAHMDKWDGEVFIKALLLSPDKSVLEIGIGTGRLAMRVCDKCRHFTGIDISRKTMQRAKANLQRFSNTDLNCGDFLTYPFSDRLDIIYVINQEVLRWYHKGLERYQITPVFRVLVPDRDVCLQRDIDREC